MITDTLWPIRKETPYRLMLLVTIFGFELNQ